MRIDFDLDSLTDAQREHVAGFLLTYPRPDAPAKIAPLALAEVGAAIQGTILQQLQTAPPTQHVSLPQQTTAGRAELAQLQKEHEDSLQPTAPSTAAALPFSIVPEAMPAPTSSAMPSVPVPPVPSAVPSAPPAAHHSANPVELDKHGLPWDSRIHAGSKAKNADGSWRVKRGVDDSTTTQVTAELQALMAAPVAIPQPPSISEAATLPGPGPAPEAAFNAFASSHTSAADEAESAFTSLIALVASSIGNGTLNKAEDLNPLCAAFGITAVPMLGARMDMIPNFRAHVEAKIAARKAMMGMPT